MKKQSLLILGCLVLPFACVVAITGIFFIVSSPQVHNNILAILKK